MEAGTKRKRDGVVLLKLFPEEVWTLIFLKLDFFLDIFQNICNSSLFFRCILRPPCVLFPKALSLLENKLSPKQRRIYPPQNPSPVKNVLAKIRSVCKAWSHTVNKLAHPYSTRYRFCLVTRLTLAWKSLNDPEDEFITKFSNSHSTQTSRSPFIGNFLKIYIDKHFQNPNTNAFVNPPDTIFKQVLQKYGCYIRHCEITLKSIGSTGLWKAKYLVNVLSIIPNLETLVLIMSPCYRQDWERRDPTVVRWEDLPDLTKLRRFGAKGVMKHFLNKLLAKMPNLERVEVGHFPSCTAFTRDLTDSKPIILPPCKLTNLRHLEVDLMSDCYHERDHSRVEDCDPWSLDWAFHYAMGSLKTISGLPIESLELAVTCSASEVWFEWRRGRFQFPQLRKFKLVTKNWPCIDFVQQVKGSLKEFCIEVNAKESYATWKQNQENLVLIEDEKIKFLGCLDNLRVSNIWELMPELEIVKIRVKLPGASNFGETKWKRETATK